MRAATATPVSGGHAELLRKRGLTQARPAAAGYFGGVGRSEVRAEKCLYPYSQTYNSQRRVPSLQ